MPVNWFAPASAFSLAPEKASGVRELQALVAAFHRRGIAVVLDVVYNHVGEPAHLLFIDKLYYFEQDAAGQLANWSGCGNDLRARAAMARRLIIDSCLHLIEAFGVDGFRFDLAELLGVEALREIEVALKRVKPDVMLIAEPWSFRGHIAGALRDTGWTSWNDGYRDFMREFVRGGSGAATFEYFVKGSPWYWAKWPAQTVNYTESHDDRTWIDAITENPDHNGHSPDGERPPSRTHLMAAMLFIVDRHPDDRGRAGFPAFQAGHQQHLPARRHERARLPAALPVSLARTRILRIGSPSGGARPAGCCGCGRGRPKAIFSFLPRRTRRRRPCSITPTVLAGPAAAAACGQPDAG
jgi:hypothetical protein